MIKEVKIKTNNLFISYDELKNLSIQFSLDGFSFCISNKKNIIGNLTQYLFDKSLKSPEELLLKIETIFKENKDLHQDFNQIIVYHQNDLFTFVPDVFFDKKLLKKYLNFSIKTLATDYISYDSITEINAKNIYVPYVNINNYLFQHFGKFEYKHHLTVLIEKLLSDKKNSLQFYVYVSSTTLSIVVIKNNLLLLANVYNFTTKEDFIYYILFVSEQLKLNPNKFLLTFLGEIEKESEIYKITYQYIRNITFYKSNNPILTKDFSKHSQFILVK